MHLCASLSLQVSELAVLFITDSQLSVETAGVDSSSTGALRYIFSLSSLTRQVIKVNTIRAHVCSIYP